MFRINAALASAKENGIKVMKKDIAARLWPNSSPAAQQVNMTKLCNGKQKKINPEWVKIVCELTGVSANFLLGIE